MHWCWDHYIFSFMYLVLLNNKQKNVLHCCYVINTIWLCTYWHSLQFFLLSKLYKFAEFFTSQPTLAIPMTGMWNTQLDRRVQCTSCTDSWLGEVQGVALARYRINVKTHVWALVSFPYMYLHTHNIRHSIDLLYPC